MNIFKRKPRAVSEIISTFTDVVAELDQRVAADEAEIARSREQIAELQSDIAQSESSKNDAIAVRSRIKDLLGL